MAPCRTFANVSPCDATSLSHVQLRPDLLIPHTWIHDSRLMIAQTESIACTILSCSYLLSTLSLAALATALLAEWLKSHGCIFTLTFTNAVATLYPFRRILMLQSSLATLLFTPRCFCRSFEWLCRQEDPSASAALVNSKVEQHLPSGRSPLRHPFVQRTTRSPVQLLFQLLLTNDTKQRFQSDRR